MKTFHFTTVPVWGIPLRAALLLLVISGMVPLHAQVSNDACTAAAANRYVVGTTCVPRAFNKPTNYNYNYNPGGCNAGNYDDAFGSFIATSNLTTVRYTPSGGTDAILHVLASCTGPSLGCSDGAGNNGTETVTVATVPGNTYYVRVQRYNSNAAMNGTLCLFNATCLYTLTLYDSYGDGWAFGGQAYVEIIVGGVSLGLWSLNNGFSGTVNFGVIDGQTVQVIYYTGGAAYVEENSFELTTGGECLFSTYAPPNVQVPYTTVADCTPSPAALPQDCAGGATICGDESIYDNNATTGCVLDLNASNSGCLLNYERQGSWYYFSPSASGTLGFTLVPDGPTDDYDFALWGPYATVQCPNTQPVRCSYFDGMYYNSTTTGLGNGANDDSEGANSPANGWVSTLNVVEGMVYVLYIDNWSSTGQAFDLSWQLTNGASLDCVTLPVELLELQATARTSVIDVTWATATEQNSDYFEVQRSPDNTVFTTIGIQDAAGDAQFRNDYLFTDTDPFMGANYYRLNQVDRDGTAELTHTVVAFMDHGAPGRPVIFPNPVTDVLNVMFHTPLDGSAVLFLQDAVGRQVAQSALVVLRGERTATLPTADLASGWYHLRIALPDGTLQEGGGFLKQ